MSQKVKLGNYITIKGGGTPNKAIEAYWNGKIPWMSVKDLKGTIVKSTINTITPIGLANSAANLIKKDSLIIATRMAVGKVVYAGLDTAINQDLKAITVSPGLYHKYLFYQLKSKRDYFERNSKGATVKGIKLDVLRDLVILLPPLEEQKKIAAILDAADDYRQKTKALIDKYDQLTQSLFLDMFGDPVTNPMGLPTIELGKACEFYSGKAWKKQELGSKGVKLIRISNLHKPNFPYWLYEGNIIERYKVENGDLLFSWAGVQASIDVYLYKGDTGMLNQHIYNLKPKTGIEKLFLFQLLQLNLNALRSSLGGGVGQFHLKKKDITSIKVLMPQSSDMQLYLKKVDSLNKQKQQAEASLVKAEELFSSLLQRAFKGDLTS